VVPPFFYSEVYSEFSSTHSLRKAADIDFSMVTENAGFPLTQKPSSTIARRKLDPVPNYFGIQLWILQLSNVCS
jgi:hypothetical protein